MLSREVMFVASNDYICYATEGLLSFQIWSFYLGLLSVNLFFTTTR